MCMREREREKEKRDVNRVKKKSYIGRGDGSFINPKFTGIACYVSDTIRSHVTMQRCATVSLGMLEGSKGGAGIALRIYDSTIVFVCAHLPAR